MKAELTEASEAISPVVSRRSHPAQPGEGFDAPPSLERSGSEHREGAVTSLALLERARAWEWVKDPLFARGGQGSRNKTYVMNIEEKKQILCVASRLLGSERQNT